MEGERILKGCGSTLAGDGVLIRAGTWLIDATAVASVVSKSREISAVRSFMGDN